MNRLCSVILFAQGCIIAMSIMVIPACEKQHNERSEQKLPTAPTATTAVSIKSSEASDELFDYGSEALKTALSSTQGLASHVSAFLDNPGPDTLNAAKTQWQQSIVDYRKFSGPAHISIANAHHFSKMNRLDYQIAAFPIQPGFLDSFGAHKYSGIVHNIGMPLSKKNLVDMHGLTDLSEAVLGFYAIESLLFNKGKMRAVSDFSKIESLNKELRERGFETAAEIPNNRRRKLLSLQALTLEENIAELLALWGARGENSIPGKWASLSDVQKIKTSHQALRSALTALMLEIGELNRIITEDSNQQLEISPTIKNAAFEEQQNFIHAAASSLNPLSNFYPQEKQIKLAKIFTSLTTLTEKSAPAAQSSIQEHWRAVFTLVKQASDIAVAD